MPKHPSKKPRDELNGEFAQSFVLRAASAGRNDGGAVVDGKFTIRRIEIGIIKVGPGHSGFEVVRSRDPGHAFEERIHLHVAREPRLFLFVLKGVSKDELAVAERADKHVCRVFAPPLIPPRNRRAGPIDRTSSFHPTLN